MKHASLSVSIGIFAYSPTAWIIPHWPYTIFIEWNVISTIGVGLIIQLKVFSTDIFFKFVEMSQIITPPVFTVGSILLATTSSPSLLRHLVSLAPKRLISSKISVAAFNSTQTILPLIPDLIFSRRSRWRSRGATWPAFWVAFLGPIKFWKIPRNCL